MEDSDLTPEEKALLHHVDLLTEILRRKDADKPEDQAERKLFAFLRSTGGTAIITIVLGSIFAPIVISYVQASNSRQDQAMEEYRQYLKLQQESVKDTYNLIGRMVYAAQDLITLTKPAFDLNTAVGEEKQGLTKQKQAMLNNFNDTVKEWRVKEAVQGVLISYYFYGRGSVSNAWVATERSVNRFIDCAEDVRQKFIRNHDIADDLKKCQESKDAISVELENLSQSIDASRQYTWSQFDVPIQQTSSPKSSASPAASQPLSTKP